MAMMLRMFRMLRLLRLLRILMMLRRVIGRGKQIEVEIKDFYDKMLTLMKRLIVIMVVKMMHKIRSIVIEMVTIMISVKLLIARRRRKLLMIMKMMVTMMISVKILKLLMVT